MLRVVCMAARIFPAEIDTVHPAVNYIDFVILESYQNHILDANKDIIHLRDKCRVSNSENALDKLIAATALIDGLTVVTRNTRDFNKTEVTDLMPFEEK